MKKETEMTQEVVDKREKYSINRIMKDTRLRLEQEKLLEMWIPMSDEDIQRLYRRRFKKEHQKCLKTNTSFGFQLQVFLLHQGYRI